MDQKSLNVQILVWLLIVVLGNVEVQAQENTWNLKMTAATMVPTAGGGPTGTAGFGLGLEYRLSRRLGIELGVVSTRFDSDRVEGFVFAADVLFPMVEIDVVPITARLNVHLTPDRKTDVYFGPIVGVMRNGDLEVSGLAAGLGPFPLFRAETDDSFVWGAHVGADFPIGDKGLFLTADLAYLRAEVDVVFSFEPALDLDPLMIQTGIGYRF